MKRIISFKDFINENKGFLNEGKFYNLDYDIKNFIKDNPDFNAKSYIELNAHNTSISIRKQYYYLEGIADTIIYQSGLGRNVKYESIGNGNPKIIFNVRLDEDRVKDGLESLVGYFGSDKRTGAHYSEIEENEKEETIVSAENDYGDISSRLL